MEVKVEKLTNKDLMDRACSFTANKEVHPNLRKMYLSEHSPIRTQLFWIEMKDIYTFVSVHFVRHSIGMTHFVKSNREDSPGYTGDKGRYHPVNHAILINAQALINMAKLRLCYKAHEETRNVMNMIVDAIKVVDPELAEFLVPQCKYRGKCCEPKSCGRPFV